MKLAKLLHNPGAGDENHDKKEILKQIRSNGFECIYTSSKNKDLLSEIEDDVDFLIVAGGDGTIRKVVKKLLARKLIDKSYPVALLPMGTANNISKTLGLGDNHDIIIKSWAKASLKKIDVGKISQFDPSDFFIEGLGYGIFPRLIKDMREVDKNLTDTPENSLKVAIQKLHDIIHSYKAKYCRIEADGINYSGKYILVEVLNMASIGPNLTLAPKADPGDGFFELILITEDQKDEFASYIFDKLNGKEKKIPFENIKAKDILLEWEGKLIHVDDELIDIEKGQEIKVQIMEGRLDFLVS